MKNILTIVFVFIFGLQNFAQITISDAEGNPFEDGETYALPLETNFEGIPYIVTNNSGSDITILIEVVIWENVGNGLAVCGNGNCVSLGTYSGSTLTIGNTPTTLTPDASTTAEATHIQCLATPILGDYLTIKVFEQGNESNSVTFTLDTDYTEAIYNINTKNLSSVYPNPATDYFTVKCSNVKKDSKLVLTNVLGKVIYNVNIDKNELNFSTNKLRSGIYFYSIIENNEVIETKKLVIK